MHLIDYTTESGYLIQWGNDEYSSGMDSASVYGIQGQFRGPFYYESLTQLTSRKLKVHLKSPDLEVEIVARNDDLQVKLKNWVSV